MMKYVLIIFAVASCLITSLFIFFFPTAPDTIDACSNVFSSNIYASYHRQLVDFLQKHPLYSQVKESPKTELNSQMKALFSLLERPLQTFEQKRAVHEAFVCHLREAIRLSSSQGPQDGASTRLLNAIVDWIYVGATLNQELEEFVYNVVERPEEDVLPYLGSTLEILRLQFSGLKMQSKKEDPYRHGNLPFVFFTLPGTTVIRCGMPIIGRLGFPWIAPKISPEFIHFVERRRSHLYVNLTKRHGREGRAAKKIEGLERKVQSLFVITLDKNSPFYEQSQDVTPNHNAALFKRAFLEEMAAKKGNYYWSAKLDREKWFQELASLLNFIHGNYFADKETLEREERRDFIELAYLEILDRLVNNLHPDSMNLTCHQGIDRAPSLLALWMMQKECASDSTLAALLLAPPLAFRNRCSHPFRIKRLVSAAKKAKMQKYL